MVAKAAGEHDERFGEVSKPVLAHEEVVELEVEFGRDVAVGQLLERQLDVEPDRLRASFPGAAVGRLHNAGAAARGNDEAVPRPGQRPGPGGDHAREGARVLVEACHLDRGLGERELEIAGLAAGLLMRGGGLLVRGRGRGAAGVLEQLQILIGFVERAEACRAEEDDRVRDAMPPKPHQGLLVFGHDANHAPVG